MFNRCAIVMMVVSLNFVFSTFWIKSSVLISTLEVASSNTKKLLFFLKSALAKQSNCFCPTEKTWEVLEISVYIVFYIDLTESDKPDYSKAYQISCYVLKLKGSTFYRIEPLKIKGVWGITEMCWRNEWSPILLASFPPNKYTEFDYA